MNIRLGRFERFAEIIADGTDRGEVSIARRVLHLGGEHRNGGDTDIRGKRTNLQRQLMCRSSRKVERGPKLTSPTGATGETVDNTLPSTLRRLPLMTLSMSSSVTMLPNHQTIQAQILVVDDDPDAVQLVVRRLQHASHKAHGVLNAADACAFVAEKGTPDIVVLDVDMPDMDGLALLTLLREQTGAPELPAIFLSGRMRPDDITAGQRLGAIYLTKPFVGTALIKAIDGIIEAAQRRTVAPNEW